MLNEPRIERRPARARPTSAVRAVPDIAEQDEGAGFMAFLGEHQQFAATHRGA